MMEGLGSGLWRNPNMLRWQIVIEAENRMIWWQNSNLSRRSIKRKVTDIDSSKRRSTILRREGKGKAKSLLQRDGMVWSCCIVKTSTPFLHASKWGAVCRLSWLHHQYKSHFWKWNQIALSSVTEDLHHKCYRWILIRWEDDWFHWVRKCSSVVSSFIKRRANGLASGVQTPLKVGFLAVSCTV